MHLEMARHVTFPSNMVVVRWLSSACFCHLTLEFAVPRKMYFFRSSAVMNLWYWVIFICDCLLLTWLITCNLVLRFYDVSFLVSNFWSLHACHLDYQEHTLYQNGNVSNSLLNMDNYLCIWWCSGMHKNDEVIRILRRSSLNGCLVWLSKLFHAKWLICGGGESLRYACVLAVL